MSVTGSTALDTHHGWRVAFSAMLCLVVGPSAMLVGSFGIFVEPLSREFGWSRGAISFAVSLIAVATVIVSPIQGVLIDRIGARRLILASIPAFAAGFLAMAMLPPSLMLFYLIWAVMPVLAIGLWPTAYLKTVSGWFARRMGAAIGVVNAGIGLGMIAMPIVAHQLVIAFGVRHAFLGMALLVMAAWPIAALVIRERAPDVGAENVKPGWRYRDMVRQREWRILAAGFFLLGIGGTGLIASLVPILMARGLSASTAVAGMGAFGAAALVGRLGTGLLLDRFRAAPVAGMFAAIAAVAMLVLAGTASVPVALIAAGALGLISGAEFDVLAYALRRYFALASFGKIYGAIFSIFQFGAGLGAAMLAASVGYTGDYAAALYALAGSSILFIVVILRLPAYPITPLEAPA